MDTLRDDTRQGFEGGKETLVRRHVSLIGVYLQQVRPDPALSCQGRVSSIKLEKNFQSCNISH